MGFPAGTMGKRIKAYAQHAILFISHISVFFKKICHLTSSFSLFSSITPVSHTMLQRAIVYGRPAI